MEELEALVTSIPDIDTMSHADRIRLFAWFLHSKKQVTRFWPKDIGECYDALSLERPSNLTRAVDALTEAKPKHLVRDSAGYYLVRAKREQHEEKYGSHEILVQVTKLLNELPEQVKDLTESSYLKETLICLRHGAFRACIVMAWNLAYSHFCGWLLKHHIAKFNSQWPIRFPEQQKKAKIKTISSLSDFSELKESEVIEIARSAGLISGNIHKILGEKLTRRNMAAHPSTIKISHLQAEECIDDLVKNIVLALV